MTQNIIRGFSNSTPFRSGLQTNVTNGPPGSPGSPGSPELSPGESSRSPGSSSRHSSPDRAPGAHSPSPSPERNYRKTSRSNPITQSYPARETGDASNAFKYGLTSPASVGVRTSPLSASPHAPHARDNSRGLGTELIMQLDRKFSNDSSMNPDAISYGNGSWNGSNPQQRQQEQQQQRSPVSSLVLPEARYEGKVGYDQFNSSSPPTTPPVSPTRFSGNTYQQPSSSSASPPASSPPSSPSPYHQGLSASQPNRRFTPQYPDQRMMASTDPSQRYNSSSSSTNTSNTASGNNSGTSNQQQQSPRQQSPQQRK